MKMRKRGFTLVEILIVVAILGLLAAVGIPNFLGSRQRAEQNMREINISSINAAKDQWAILNNRPNGTTVTFADIQDFLSSNISSIDDLKVGGESITIGNIGTSASYPSCQ